MQISDPWDLRLREESHPGRRLLKEKNVLKNIQFSIVAGFEIKSHDGCHLDHVVADELGHLRGDRGQTE